MTHNKLTTIGQIMLADSTLCTMLALKNNGTERAIFEDEIPVDDYVLPAISYQFINGGFYNPIINQDQFFIRIHSTYSADVLTIGNRIRVLFDDTSVTYNGVTYKAIIDTGVNTVSEDVCTHVYTLTLKQLKGV